MITLARHIELLLLEHDCVIVPGLGGFIANNANARYTGGDECLFLPPYRTVGFSQQLQVNDGLLVQSYMTAYDASYPAAHLQMEKDIEKLMYELEMNGEYNLEAIGTLKKELNGNITFSTPEPGLLTPLLYGLYSYEMQSLASVTKARKIEQMLQAATTPLPVEKDPATTDEKKQPITIRLNRRWLDLSISAAAAVLLFFGFSYPSLNHADNQADTVVATFYQPKKTIAQPTTTTVGSTTKETKPTKVKAEKILPAPIQEAPEKQQAAAVTEQPQTAAQYAIVLASYVSQANAEVFIKQLTKEGFAEGRYTKTGKVSRVLYANFASETEAQKALQSLRQENEKFAEAWVLALPQ